MRTGKYNALVQRLAPAMIPILYAVILLLVSPLHDTFEEWDGVVQMFAGKEMVSGLGYTWGVSQRWPPLYPLLIGLGSRIVSGFDAAKLISIIAAVILLYVVYLLALELSGKRRVSLLAQAFLVLNPRYVVSSFQAENHMLESLFLVSALVLFIKSLRSPTKKRWLAVGFITGLACLSRYTSYALLPVFVVALFLDSRQAVKAVVILIASFTLVNLPWWYANALANGSPFASTLHIPMGWHVIADGTTYKWWWDTHTNYQSVLDVFTASPRGYLMNVARNIYSSGKILIITGGALAPFVVPAAFHAILSLARKHWAILLGGAATYILLVSQALVADEYLLGITVVFCILSVLFLCDYLAQVSGTYPSLRKYHFGNIVVTALLLAGLALTSWRVYGYVKWDDYDNGQMANYRAITAVLKERDPDIAHKYVMSVNPARAYYLGSAYLPPPLYYEDSVDGLVSWRGIKPEVEMLNMRFPSSTPLETARADYLIYDVGLRSHLPQFAFLFDPASDKIPGNFELVYQSRDAVVYEILWQ
jgi:hypothetical protein